MDTAVHVSPPEALPLHQARGLLQAKNGSGRAKPVAASDAPPWLVVTGGKGGVGKTLVAVNLAILTARAGHRTLLVDLDPGLANVDVQLRAVAERSLEDLADGRCSAREALHQGPAGVHCLFGRSGSPRLTGGDPVAVDAVLAAVDRCAADQGFDVVICDTGAGIGTAVRAAARRARLALAVTTPDPGALTDAYALAKLLLQDGCAPPHLLLNQVRSRDQALRTAGRLAAVAQRFLGTTLPLAGWLHAAAAIDRSIREQRPVALVGAEPAVGELRAVAAHVLSAMAPLARLNPRPRP